MKNVTEDELEKIRDKFRGYPRQKIEEFAASIDVDPDELIQRTREFLQSGEYWNEGDKFSGIHSPPEEYWDWYELVTGEVVPMNKREGFFTCAC